MARRMSSSPRQPAIGFIFVTLTLSIVGFGLLIPVLPPLILKFKAGDMTEGSHTYGWLVSLYALMQFVGSPVLGALSDQFGRRRIILIATAGSAIDYVIMACAPNLIWLFIARTIAGFTAGVYATANAYLADVTPPEKRAGAFGILGAAFGIGFVVGPALGGFLGKIDIHLPFWVAAGCSAANWFWGLLVLPESLKPENRRPFSWKRANPISALYALKRIPAVLGLAESYFILMVAQTMLFSIWALYTGYRYQWGPDAVGLSLMFVGVLSGLVQAVLVKRIVPWLGETRAVLVGFSISIFVNVCYGLAPYGWLIYVIMAIGAFAGISGPALQSYITKHVPANEQGATQGALGSLQSLAGVLGPVVATWSFGWAIAPERTYHAPGIAFFIGAALVATAAYLAWRSFRKDAATV
jgi:DHA1 family tetracycline resistance protein-like MFS transporter